MGPGAPSIFIFRRALDGAPGMAKVTIHPLRSNIESLAGPRRHRLGRYMRTGFRDTEV